MMTLLLEQQPKGTLMNYSSRPFDKGACYRIDKGAESMDPRIIIAAAVLIAVSLFDYYVWSGLMHSSIPGSVVAFAILAIISVGMTVFAIAFIIVMLTGDD